MNVHKHKTDPGVLLAEGQALLEENCENNFRIRVMMVNLQLLGKITTQKLSDATRIPVRTLQHWLKSADENGWESLKEPVYAGGKSRLSEEQQEEIRQVLLADKPENEGFKVWNTRTLALYIKNKYNIEYTQSTTSRLFRKLGFRLIRPTTDPSLEKPDKEAQEEFKENSSRRWRTLPKK